MIEGKSPADLMRLAQAGASLRLDGRRYGTSDLVMIARSLHRDALLTLANSEGKQTSELVSIVYAAPGKVTIA